MLILDSGNLFFKSIAVSDYLKDQWALQADFLVEQFNEIGCDGLGVGQNEFALGIDFLKKLEKKANFPFLSANIVDKKTNKPVFKPYAIKKALGFKFGLFSVYDSSLPLPRELKALDQFEVSKSMVQKLSSQVDFIIAVTHQGLEQDIKLAQKISGIDFIVSGSDGPKLLQPRKVNETLIVQASDKGKYIGVLGVSLKKNLHRYVSKQGVLGAGQQLKLLDLKISEVQKLKQGSLYQSDVQFKKSTDQKEQDLLQQKFGLSERIQAAKTSANTYTNEVVALDKEVFKRGDGGVFDKVQDFKSRLSALAESKETQQKIQEAQITSKGNKLAFATYRRCQQCHTNQYEVWKDSKHASAMLPLYFRNQHNNAECIGCHSVGFQKQGGFANTTQPFVLDEKTRVSTENFLKSLFDFDESKVPKNILNDQAVSKIVKSKKFKGSMLDLREHPEFDAWIRKKYVKESEKKKWKRDFSGVQCENCHGARGLKNSMGKEIPHFSETGFSKKVFKSTCVQCHNPSRDAHFDFKADNQIKGVSGANQPFQCAAGVF